MSSNGQGEQPAGPGDRGFPSHYDAVQDRQPRDGYLGDGRDGKLGGRTS